MLLLLLRYKVLNGVEEICGGIDLDRCFVFPLCRVVGCFVSDFRFVLWCLGRGFTAAAASDSLAAALLGRVCLGFAVPNPVFLVPLEKRADSRLELLGLLSFLTLILRLLKLFSCSFDLLHMFFLEPSRSLDLLLPTRLWLPRVSLLPLSFLLELRRLPVQRVALRERLVLDCECERERDCFLLLPLSVKSGGAPCSGAFSNNLVNRFSLPGIDFPRLN